MPTLTLPDGRTTELPEGEPVGSVLPEQAIAARVDGELVDLSFVPAGDAGALAGLGPGGPLHAAMVTAPPAWAAVGLQVVSAPTWRVGLLALRTDRGLTSRKTVRQAVALALEARAVTEYTRPATWDDLKRVAEYLNAERVEYALIGGYAIAAHGFNRFSEDLDILVNPSRENTGRWIRALSRLPDRATAELTGQDDIFEREGHYAIRVNDEFTLDVMPTACGHPWAELAPHIEEFALDGIVVKVLGLEGLLLTKEGLRDRDRADRSVLLAALERLKNEKA